jgi:hypothetical protein
LRANSSIHFPAVDLIVRCAVEARHLFNQALQPVDSALKLRELLLKFLPARFTIGPNLLVQQALDHLDDGLE